MNANMSLDLTNQIISELRSTINAVDPESLDRLVEEIIRAKRIFCLGAGRSGIMLQAFCMRLNHLGFTAFMAGGLPCPPVEEGDLIVAASGSGTTRSVTSMLDHGKFAGARLALFTSNESQTLPIEADVTIFIPAPSRLVNDGSPVSRQPMRTLFEQVFFLLCEAVVCQLRDCKGIREEDMAKRHANLE